LFFNSEKLINVNSLHQRRVFLIHISKVHNRNTCFPYLQPGGISPPKKGRTKDDFYTFCSWVLTYTQYEQWKQDVSMAVLLC